MDFGEFTLTFGAAIRGLHPMADFFLTYWEENGGLDKTIGRQDVQPQAIKKYLDRVVIMDVSGTGKTLRLNIRLIGSWVAGFYGEVTGKDVKAIENRKAVERIYAASAAAIEHESPVFSSAPALAPDRSYLMATALYLPLFEDGQVTKVLATVDVTPQKSPMEMIDP